MRPWWLRPTAESEDAQDERTDEPAPSPDDREGDSAREARTRGSDKADEPEGDRPRKGGRRRSPRSRRSDDPGDGRRGSSRKEKDEEAPRKERRAGGRKDTKPARRSKPDRSDQPGKDRARKDRSAKGAQEPAPHDITAEDIETIHRELFDAPEVEELESLPERNASVNDERKIAMFCDLENIALGVRDSDIKKFDITLVLERLLEKGKIIVKRAYCDWERYNEYKRPFHESAIEMLDIPQKYYSGKNSADIKMVVDAMDLCYAKEHLDTFVLLSGDSDFSPLVSKLKENDKYVIGVGVKNSSSNLLVDNCDEFIYYEDIHRDRQKGPQLAGVGKKTAEAFELMIDAIQALIRENKDVLWGSMIKQTMQRKRPSFNEGYYGYGSFSELLEDAQKKNILKLKKDQRSGTYIVTGFAQR